MLKRLLANLKLPGANATGRFLCCAVLALAPLKESQAQCNPKEYYDQLMSAFHSTIAHNTNGTYSIWGQQSKSSGAADHTSPMVITAGAGADQYNFTGNIRMMSLASSSTTHQFFMLTTDDLYTWGAGTPVVDGLTSGAFHPTALPGTVTPGSVKIMTASTHALVLVTNSGEVWVKGNNATYSFNLYGDGSASSDASWHKVTINTAGTPALSGVTQIGIQGRNGIFAYVASTGKWYTWGTRVMKGDGSASAARNRAEEMTAPFSGAPKMIEATATSAGGLSYFALNPADGKLYALGGNASGQLGQNTSTDATSWVKVKNAAGSADLSDVIFISANQHDYQYGSVAAIVSSGTLYLWGNNNNSMLGQVGSGTILLPTVPRGFAAGTDKCLYVEIGGHTSVYVKDGNKKYCYVGHKISGSMGDGSSSTGTVDEFDCTTTADAKICGATSFDAGDAPESYEGDIIGFHDIVDFTTSLYLGNTAPGFNNNNFKNVVPGADNTGGLGDGWEEDGISGPPNYRNTGSFSVDVRVRNSTGSAKNLYGWIDWNLNGTFDASEMINVSVPDATAGGGFTTATLNWPVVPTDLLRKQKYYMRLRLTSDVLTSANGFARDGELEDFYVKVPIFPPVAANIATSMSNNNPATPIPALVGSEAQGQIDSFKITTLPSAAAGILYFCNPTCAAVTAGQVIPYADRNKLQFDPAGSSTGDVTFNYLAIDSNQVSSSPAIYTITTTNQPPVANNVASTTIVHGSSSPVPPLRGFDADGTVSSYRVTSLPNPATVGTLTYCSTPPSTGCGTPVPAGTDLTPAQIATLSFTPVMGYEGTVNIPYTVKDNNNNTSNTAYLSIPVGGFTSEDTPPVADNILNPVMSNNNGSTPIAPINGTDMRGIISKYTITSVPPASEGILYLCDPACTPVTAGQDLTPAQKDKLQFDPAATFTGNVTFTYTATNNRTVPVTSAPATVTIPIGNNPPIAEHLVYNSITRNKATNTLLPPLTASDYDGTVVEYSISTIPPVTEGILYLCTTPPSGGCSAVTAGQVLTPAEAAKLTFKPATDYTGTANFTYAAKDNNGKVSPVANYNIIVNTDPANVGNPPVTQNLATQTTSGAPVNIASLIGSDPDADLNHYVIASLPPASEGVLQFCNPACAAVTPGQSIAPADIAKLRFVPAAGFTGTATITYYAMDDNLNISNFSDIKVTVTNVPPVAVDITAPKQLNTAGPATLPSLSATDADGTVTSYVITSLPGTNEGILRLCTIPPATGCTPVTVGQVLLPAEVSRLTFDPLTTFTGYAKFGYTAIDNNGNIGNAAKVTIAAGGATALPVALVSYDATASGCTAILKWTTASASDIQRFEVQWSRDGQKYTKAAVLDAVLISGQEHKYTYNYTMDAGVNYLFRVSCIYADGSNTYSPASRLNCNDKSLEIITAPNPVSDVLHVSGMTENTTITLLQNDGRMLQQFNSNDRQADVDMKQYAKGVYLLKIVAPDGNTTLRRIVKQ